MRPTTLFLLGLLAAACGKAGPQPAAPAAQADGARLVEVPDFLFQERSGQPLGRAALKGKVWIATLIFTSCRTTCIPMSVEMSFLQDEFRDEPDFRIVAITVDPQRDTPEVLRNFASGYGAHPERWLFLRSSLEETRALAHEGLKLPWHAEDRLAHSTHFVLVDREGWVRGYFNQVDEDRMEALRATIRRVLAEKAP